jgi:hypothetical protein
MEMMLYCYSWPGNWKKARNGRTGDHRYMLEHSNKISHFSSEEARSSVSKTPWTSSTYCHSARYYPTTNFGISSVSVTLPHSNRKSRYLSSSYCPNSPQTTRLIIGRCVGEIVTD